jgi:hypothetical protein
VRKKENHQISKRNTRSPELAAPSSPIVFEGEESPGIESFEERIARFEVETLVQQWYGEASFSGSSFDYYGMAGASSSHPPPFDPPPLQLTLMMIKKKRKAKKKMMTCEASRRPIPHLFVLNDKGGGGYRLKLEGSTQFILVSILSEKTGLSGFANRTVRFYPAEFFIYLFIS